MALFNQMTNRKKFVAFDLAKEGILICEISKKEEDCHHSITSVPNRLKYRNCDVE